MSIRRNPIYVFENVNSEGIFSVPVGSLVQIIDGSTAADGSGPPILTQLNDKIGLSENSVIGDYLSNTSNYTNLDKDTLSQLELVQEGGKTGWRLLGTDSSHYGNIGADAVDFSTGDGSSSGALGDRAFAVGSGTRAKNKDSVAIGSNNVGVSNTSILEVGMGTSSSKKNAFEVHSTGIVIAPELTTAILNTASLKTLTTKEYVDSRVGVTLADTDGLAEGTTNLYYTDTRAEAAAQPLIDATPLSGLSDVNVTGALANQILKYNGFGWIPGDDNNDVFSVNTKTGAVVLITDDISEGAKKYYSEAQFNSSFSGKTTTDLPEGTNKYYTDVKSKAAADIQIATAKLGDLFNVDETGAVNNRVLTYDGSQWKPKVVTPDAVSSVNTKVGAVVLNLDDIDGVDLTTTAPVNADVLTFDGTNWVPDIVGGGSSGGPLGGLSDVTLTAPASNQVLKYDGLEWVNAAVPSNPLNYASDVSNAVAVTGDILKHDGTDWLLEQGPVTITVVNDLTTGGTTDALSSEQGKVLKDTKAEITPMAALPVDEFVNAGRFIVGRADPVDPLLDIQGQLEIYGAIYIGNGGGGPVPPHDVPSPVLTLEKDYMTIDLDGIDSGINFNKTGADINFIDTTSAINFAGDTSSINFTGDPSSINFTGDNSGISMAGDNNSIILDGAGSYVELPLAAPAQLEYAANKAYVDASTAGGKVWDDTTDYKEGVIVSVGGQTFVSLMTPNVDNDPTDNSGLYDTTNWRLQGTATSLAEIGLTDAGLSIGFPETTFRAILMNMPAGSTLRMNYDGASHPVLSPLAAYPEGILEIHKNGSYSVINNTSADLIKKAYAQIDSGNIWVPWTSSEIELGNPTVDGDMLVSTAAGVRSWSTPLAAIAVVDDLATASSTDALSANQGVILDSKISTNANDIITNAANTSTNAASIVTNATDIATNATNIAAEEANRINTDANVSANNTLITTHTAASNPHSVTKTQITLGNVDNTSDATKAASGNPVGDKIATKINTTEIGMSVQGYNANTVIDANYTSHVKGGAVANIAAGTNDAATNEAKINELLGSLRTANIIA